MNLETNTNAPTVACAAPTANQEILLADFGSGTIKGLATDKTGVAAVKVRLGRKRDGVNAFWNGTDWVANPRTTVDADLVGTTVVDWSLGTNAPPQNKLDVGTYDLRIYSVDALGNRSPYVGISFSLGADFAE